MITTLDQGLQKLAYGNEVDDESRLPPTISVTPTSLSLSFDSPSGYLCFFFCFRHSLAVQDNVVRGRDSEGTGDRDGRQFG